jgi:hypothetical protein
MPKKGMKTQPPRIGQPDPNKDKKGRPWKFTEQYCQDELEWMLDYITNTTEGSSVIFVQELCNMRDYDRDRWNDSLNNFPDNDYLSGMIKKIENILETRLAKGMLGGQLNATGAIFTLKNKYKWRDKHEIEQSGGLNVMLDTNLHKLNTEELKTFQALLKKAS